MADVRAAEVRVQLPTAPQRRFGLRAHDCTNLADTPSQPNKARTRRKAGHRAGGRPPSKKAKSAAKAKASAAAHATRGLGVGSRVRNVQHLPDGYAVVQTEVAAALAGTAAAAASAAAAAAADSNDSEAQAGGGLQDAFPGRGVRVAHGWGRCRRDARALWC
jgi:Spy/CpxP family protein refolding chaperone